MKKRYHQSIVALGMAAAALILFLAPDFSAAASQKRGPTHTEGGDVSAQLPVQKVTITRKTIDMVISNIGDRYAVDRETIIAGLDGQQVSIRELLVPCDVEITYENQNRRRHARRIKVLRLFNEANSKRISLQPE